MEFWKKWLHIAAAFVLTLSLLSPAAVMAETDGLIETETGQSNETTDEGILSVDEITQKDTENQERTTSDTATIDTEDISPSCVSFTIRVESWLETLIPFQEMCIEPYDDPDLSLSANNLVVGHAIFAAFRDAENKKVSLDDVVTQNGTYISHIGDYGEFVMGSGMDGWMYKLNYNWANGIASEPLNDGDRIDLYYVGNYFDVVFTEMTASKTEAATNEEVVITLKDVDTQGTVSDATIYINGVPSSYKTDVNGEAQLLFDTAGVYEISAERYKDDPADMSDNNNIIRPVPIQVEVITSEPMEDAVVTNVKSLISNLPAIEEASEINKLALQAARQAYDALTEEQKALITNIQELIEKENTFASLTKIAEVIAKIAALPSVENIQLANKEAVQKVLADYDALTPSQQAKVTNIEKLRLLIEQLNDLSKPVIAEERAYETASNYMISKAPNPKFGNEWFIISLARGGASVPGDYFDIYYKNVVNHVKNVKGELDARKYTEYSRLILALTAIGKDPRDVGGYDIVEKLSDFDKVTWQGVNGAYYGLIALGTWDFELPETATTTKQKLVDFILEKQFADGGWALSGTKADPDMTGMAIQSLAPYYNSQPKVKAAVDRALITLANIQLPNGGYASWGAENVESATQVAAALISLGIDPKTDARFDKVLPNIMTYYNESDGGFKHILSQTKADGMATEQVGYTLAAYKRLLNGQTALYDMSDTKSGETPKPEEPKPEEPKPEEPKPEEPKPEEPGDIYGYSSYSIVISSSEIPLATTAIEFYEGESVFDVLKRATELHGIPLSYRETQYGTYIDGIDDLYEFDRGPLSGWMYRVNGVFPAFSAALYTLQPGDRVEWLYTLDLGKDVGGYVDGIEDDKIEEELKEELKEELDKKENEEEIIKEDLINKEDGKIEVPVEGNVDHLQAKITNEQLSSEDKQLVIQHPNGTKVELPTAAITLAAGETASVSVEQTDRVIDIQLSASTKEGATKGIALGKAYAKVTIPAPQATANTVVLQEVNGEYRAVPHQIINGEIILLVKTSGSFVLMEESITFNDIQNLANKEEVEFLASRHVIKGTDTGDFAPNEPVTRGQFAAMISRALGLQAEKSSKFTDTKGKWYENDIQALFEAGITNGKTASMFDPDTDMTRQQAAAFMARILDYVNYETEVGQANYKDAEKINAEFKEAIALLNQLDIMTGKDDGTFDAQGNLTRIQMAKILKRTLNVAGLM